MKEHIGVRRGHASREAIARPTPACIQRVWIYRPGSREFSLLIDGLVPASAIFLVSGSPFVGFVSCLWLSLLLQKETDVTAFISDQAIEMPAPQVTIGVGPVLVPTA